MEPILTVLDTTTISDNQKKELLTIVDVTTHYLVTDIILTELKSVDKKKFMDYVAKDEHEKIWDLLTKKINDVEHKIRLAVRDVHLSMIDDVKKLRK